MTVNTCAPGFDLRSPALRWGIAAPGEIAADFVRTLKRNTDQRVEAVASRSQARAEQFGDRFEIPTRCGSYDELADNDVDVIYVAAVNSAHADIALRALEGGKHVLVEKPLAMNATEAARIADAAKSAGVLVMEGMWTRYLPTYVELARQLDAGLIGDVRIASVSIGWQATPAAAPRLWDPSLGGGVTLDMGVYGLWFAQFAVGRPVRLLATGQMIDGVDAQVAISIAADGGRLATVSTSLLGTMSGQAEIVGTEATVTIADHVVFSRGFAVTSRSGRHEWRDDSTLAGRDGLAWEAVALATYVAEGRTDSPVHSLADAVALATSMDSVRDQIGHPPVAR
jgi:predicted dehydrogenase